MPAVLEQGVSESWVHQRGVADINPGTDTEGTDGGQSHPVQNRSSRTIISFMFLYRNGNDPP